MVDLVSLGLETLPEDAGNLLRAGAFRLRLDHDDTGLAARPTGMRYRAALENVVRWQCPGNPVNHRHGSKIPYGYRRSAFARAPDNRRFSDQQKR